MSTRSAKISASVHALTRDRPRLFGVCLAVCLAVALAGGGLALAALLSGPIGVELQDPFWGAPLSRLRVLQMAAPLALVFGLGFVLLWAQRFGGSKALGGAWEVLQKWCPLENEALFWLSLGAVALWVNVEMLLRLPLVAFVEPDTVGYLAPSALRSAGYMLVIKTVVAIAGDLKWIVPVQLNTMLVSFVALGAAARGVLRNSLVGWVVAVVPMVSAGLLILAPTVMTEALFVALICFHMAAVLNVFRRLTGVNIALVGLTLGLMIVMRPNGLSFLAGIVVLVVFFKDRWRLVLAGTLGPVVALVVAQGVYHQQTFGFFGLHKFGGISLAGAAAPLIRADMDSPYPALAASLAQSLQKYYVDFGRFEDRAFPFEIADAASITAVGAIYGQILPAIRKQLGLPAPRVMAFEYDPRIDAIAASLALSAIRNDPWGFAKIVTSTYIKNWFATLPIRVPMAIFYPRSLTIAQSVAQRYGDELTPVMDLGVYRDRQVVTRIDQVGRAGLRLIEAPRLVVGVFQLALALAAFVASAIGLVGIFKRRWRLDGAGRVLVYSAVVLQAGYGLMSIANASFVRYTVVFDPIVILLLLTAALMGWSYVFADKSVS